MQTPARLRFFLGANSAQGFVSRFDQMTDLDKVDKVVVIKGAAGTGKSTLMKRAAEELAGKNDYIEEIYCSSDVDSLDGVIFPTQRIAIADGTPPHAIEPRYPGVQEDIFSLYDCWDRKKLYEYRDTIVEYTQKCSSLHKLSASYLYAAGSLLTQLQAIAKEVTSEEKIERLALSIANREFKTDSKSETHERIRFVSGITNKGPMLFEDTIHTLAPRLYIISDNLGYCAAQLMQELRRLALQRGQNIITCYCPLFPYSKIDHLLFPDLGIGFVTSNKLHPVTLQGDRIIHARRFMNTEKLKAHKHKISFLLRASLDMMEQAGSLIGEAKQNHEDVYKRQF